MLRHLINILFRFLPPTRLFYFKSILLKLAGIKLGNNVCFCGNGKIYGNGDLYIGDNSWISPDVVIHTHKDASIYIGSNCDIAPGVLIHPGTHLIGHHRRRAGIGIAKAVRIGDGCWVGARSVILGGVNLADGSVIGAGSVVLKSTRKNSLTAGVPAKFIKTLAK